MTDESNEDSIVNTVNEAGDNNDDGGDKEISLDRIKTECSAMVRLLKNLQDEEHNLDCQLKILAREALLCGFSVDLVEPPQPKRRRMTGRKKQTAKQEKRGSTGPAVTSTTEPFAVAEVVATVVETDAKEEDKNSTVVEAEIVAEDQDES